MGEMPTPLQERLRMADDPNEFRDPKVTTGEKTSTANIGRWIPFVIGLLLAILLLGWVLGFFSDDNVDTAVVPVEDGAVVVTD